jgi:hypothetical protein
MKWNDMTWWWAWRILWNGNSQHFISFSFKNKTNNGQPMPVPWINWKWDKAVAFHISITFVQKWTIHPCDFFQTLCLCRYLNILNIQKNTQFHLSDCTSMHQWCPKIFSIYSCTTRIRAMYVVLLYSLLHTTRSGWYKPYSLKM